MKSREYGKYIISLIGVSSMFESMLGLWTKYYMIFLAGLWKTIWISVVVLLIGIVFGTLVALMRMSKFKIFNAIAVAFVEVIRDTPTLLQLYFFWLLLPKILPIDLSEPQCIIIALIVGTSAFVSEIIRAGINAVDKGQWEAAQSIGLTKKNMMIHVIFPQAIKNILPALGNEFISTVKGTSLASVFFVGELMTSWNVVKTATFLSLESLMIVGIIYFILNFTLSRLLSLFERRMKASD